jgi:hypothetical protein
MPVESPGESAVRRFYRWRALTRILFLLGCALVLIPAAGARAAPEVMSPAVRDAVAMVGLLMLLAVFPLYWYAVNRCPCAGAPSPRRRNTPTMKRPACRSSNPSHGARSVM